MMSRIEHFKRDSPDISHLQDVTLYVRWDNSQESNVQGKSENCGEIINIDHH